ncbi:MAG: endolytic transglycosylase MltG [Clostridiales bacterium]|nr:endolytic transglycosylase MltG [Clostridiales bacterium]
MSENNLNENNLSENDLNEEESLEHQLEESRRKKVESFKVNFGDDFFGNTVSDDISSDSGRTEDSNKAVEEDSISSASEFFESAAVDNTEEIASFSAVGVQHQFTNEELKEQRRTRKAAEKAERKRRKIKAKRNGHIFTLFWVLLVAVVGVSLGKFGLVGANDFLAINRTDSDTVSVTIPKKADINEISEILQDRGVINNSFFFEMYSRLTKSDKDFNQGIFEIPKNKDYEAIVNFLQSNSNRKDIVTIQFSEGMTVEDIAKKLSDENVCDYDAFLELCKSDTFDEDYDFLAAIDSGKRLYKLEGYLFPDTYDFYVGEDPEDTISRFLANFRSKCITEKVKISGYDKRVNIRKQAQLQGYTLDEIINIASIIQKESADDTDMLYVSSVLRNRLDTLDDGGYSSYGEYNLSLLQSEAVYYYMKKLPKNMQKYFDTEKVEGLPGGAICNPGISAINAALNPKDTDYYYFCHKAATEESAAEPYYARTLDEHNYNLSLVKTDDE